VLRDPFGALTLLVGRREGIRPVQTCSCVSKHCVLKTEPNEKWLQKRTAVKQELVLMMVVIVGCSDSCTTTTSAAAAAAPPPLLLFYSFNGRFPGLTVPHRVLLLHLFEKRTSHVSGMEGQMSSLSANCQCQISKRITKH